jgi:hypothetical protein
MFFPSKLLAATAGITLLAMSSTTSVSAQCALPDTYKWTPSGELAVPSSNWFSFKDLTHVMYEGKHLVYASSNIRYFGSIELGLFSNWTEMASVSQKWTTFAAITPTLFLFRPTKTWVLAYQGESSLSYRTSTDPTNHYGWSDEKPLFSGNVTAAPPSRPADPAIIGDSKNMHLFFADNNGKIYRASMPIENFPGNFGTASTVVLSDTKDNLYEAVQVYTVKGQNKYLMIVESVGVNGRYSRSFTATDLSGIWTPQAATEATPFAGKANVDPTWPNDVSHADVIRSNPDQTMTIDPCNMQVLFQGQITKAAAGSSFPYRPALLTLQT